MSDRVIKILEQDKMVLRGLKNLRNRPVLEIDEDEVVSVNFDWSEWLGSDTIDSVTNEVTGVTVSSEANDTTTASFNIAASYSGFVEHRITTAGGLTKEKLLFVTVNGFPVNDDYGLGWRLV